MVDKYSKSESKPVSSALVYHPLATGGKNIVLSTCSTTASKHKRLTKQRANLPSWNPHLALYAGLFGSPLRSIPSTSMLVASSWFQIMICFGPWTHLLWSSSHHAGGLGMPTGVVDLAFVTLHLKPSMYMLGCPHPLGIYGVYQINLTGHVKHRAIHSPIPTTYKFISIGRHGGRSNSRHICIHLQGTLASRQGRHR